MCWQRSVCFKVRQFVTYLYRPNSSWDGIQNVFIFASHILKHLFQVTRVLFVLFVESVMFTLFSTGHGRHF